MAFNDTYIESIQTKHLNNVGFTSTAKATSNEGIATRNPHQILATQIPTVDVVTTYGVYTASGIAAGAVEEHIVKLTADPTVNGNKAWLAYESDCTTSGHSSRGAVSLGQWMRYPETEYKLRLFSDTGAGAPNYSNEILPSEVQFNWEYDASAGVVYFDDDPTDGTGYIGRLWGKIYTYVGETVADSLTSVSGSSHIQNTDQYLDFGGPSQVSASDLHGDLPLPGITVSPHGFPDRFGTTLAFDDVNRQFSITPTGASFDYYDLAVKYTVATSGTVQITDTDGLWYIYYEGATLTASQTEWAYGSNVPVADVYWDATNKTSVVIADERHGVVMDPGTYEWIHKTVGARYQEGLALSYTAGDGSANSHAQISLENGIVWDGDLDYEIIDGSPQDISPVTQAPVFYRTGATGSWRKTVPDTYPVYDSVGTGRLGFNEWTGVTWQVSEVGDNGYVAVWVIATNDIDYPIISCLGQRDDTSLLNAKNNNTWEGLAFGCLPFREMKVLYRVIYRTKDTFSNAVKALVEDVQDLRSVSNFPSGTYVATDHGTLTGLADQDHPAAAIYTTITSFSGTLSSADDDVQKSLETIDGHLHDDRYYTETEIDTLSGTLSAEIDSDIAAHHDAASADHDDRYYTETEIDNMLSGQDEFLELTDTIAAYTDGRMLVETASELVDYSGLTYASGTQIFTAPNVAVTTDLTVGGDSTLTGVLGFDTGTTINEFIVTLSGSPTDDQMTTSLGVKSYVDDQITLQSYWELDGDIITNKSTYANVRLNNNLVVVGDLLVSGTQFITSTETVLIEDNLLVINNGEVGAGVTEGVAGIEVDRGTLDNYQFYFDETQDNFRVGISGSLQAVATREDTPTNDYVAVWNSSSVRFDTPVSLASLATDAEVLTISGVLSAEIDSDIAAHHDAASTDHDDRYYTETEIDSIVSDLETDITTLSGFVDDNYYDKTELDGGQLDNRYYTETEIDTLSGTLSAEIDSDIAAHHDAASADHDDRYYTETEVDNLLATQDEFLELTDTIAAYTDGRMLVETGSELTDYSGLTYASGTQIFTAPNVAVTTDLTVGGDSTLTGVLGFDTGTTINEFIVTLSGSPTDDQVTTSLGVKNYVDDLVSDTVSTVNGLGIFKNVSNSVDTTVASGTNDTLVFVGANGVGIGIGVDTNIVTISGAPQTSMVDSAMAWNASEYWEYGSGFTSVPSDLVVYYNGVRQLNHTDYYVASIVGGVLRVTFAFTTYSSDWTHIEYSQTTNTEGLIKQWVLKVANYTLINGDRVIADTSSGGANASYTLTLPANPVFGDHISVLDGGGYCGTNPLTVARNGSNIQGLAENMTVDSNNASFELVYFNAARGWVLYE